MRTITFYSYKGGTGRTLLLANIAVLAARLGRRVVAVDLDLEAPGLDYKLLGGPARGERGVIEWLETRITSRRSAPLAPYLVNVPLEEPFTEGGTLELLPAGGGPSLGYFSGLQRLALDQHLLSGDAADAFLDLQDAIRSEIDPDVLLLDARTGVATSNLATTRVMADDVVALTLDTPEQLEGTRAVLRSLTPLTSLRTQEPLGLHVVLSRVVHRPADVGTYALTDDEREQAMRVQRMLEEPGDSVESTLLINKVHLLHAEPMLARGDVLLMRRGDVIDATALHLDYVRIAETLFGAQVAEAVTSVIASRTDAPTRERLARFFGRVGDVTEARIAQADQNLRGVDEGDDLIQRLAWVRMRAAQDPTLVPDLAALLMRSAHLYQQLGQRESEIAALEEAVVIYRRLLAETTERSTLRSLARALKQLSLAYSEVRRPDDALAASTEAVAFLREAHGGDDDELVLVLTDLLMLQSSRLIHLDREEEALSAAVEASELMDRLHGPTPARPTLEHALVTLQLSVAAQGLDWPMARHAATRAVEMLGVLAAAEAPDEGAYTEHFALAYELLSEALEAVDDQDAAADAIRAAVTARRRVAAADPGAVSALTVSLVEAAQRFADAGDDESALAYGEEAATLTRDLIAADIDEAESSAWLAAALWSTSRSLRTLGRLDESVSRTRQLIGVRRHLAREGSKETRAALAAALVQLGVFLGQDGDPDGASIALNEALDIYRETANPSDVQEVSELGLATLSLGFALAQRGELVEARALMGEAIHIFRLLQRQAPDRFRDALGHALYQYAVVIEQTGDLAEADQVAREALTMAREVAARHGEAPQHLPRLLDLLVQLAGALDQPERADAFRAERRRLMSDLVGGDED